MSKVKIKQIQRRSEIIELSMAEICKAADISTGSFYHYFTKKSDILVGLLGIIDEYMETEAFACLTSEDEIENLMIFSRHWALYVDTHGLERSKLISTIEPAQEDISGEKRITTVKLEEIMTRGQEKRQIRADLSPEELAQMFLLALRGVAGKQRIWSEMIDSIERLCAEFPGADLSLCGFPQEWKNVLA